MRLRLMISRFPLLDGDVLFMRYYEAGVQYLNRRMGFPRRFHYARSPFSAASYNV